MKKKLIVKIMGVLVVLGILLLAFIQGDVSHAKTIKNESEYYSDFEIDSAIFASKLYFAFNFKDCKLIEISYAGDESIDAAKEWAKDSHASKAIILVSSFQSGSDWQSTGMEPNKLYQDWQWIMVKRFGILWFTKTNGY